MVRCAIFSIVLIVAVGPVLAKQPNSTSPPAAPPASEPAGAPTTPDLAVASVKLQGGSRLIGSAVYNDQNEKVGSADDLIMKDGNRIVMAVVSVGGSAAAPVAPDCCPPG
jgi:hypothetical protein